MKYLKNYHIHRINEKYDKLNFNDNQLILVTKNENRGFNVVKKIHNFIQGADSLYQKGDVLMFMHDRISSLDGKDYIEFKITRGHGLGKYTEDKYIILEPKDVYSSINNGTFKLIDDIREREKLLSNNK